ncbi:MAG: DegT/DnrJ/EryC1/StrS family aminotransferase [Actinobacteria bacterium]|nr:DegT/DnrJ/EryC1/StrS family aminotransferase [Actinomycetota bacterium]
METAVPSPRSLRPLVVPEAQAPEDDIPLVRPVVPDPAAVADDVERILASGILTNGPYVRELERGAAQYLGVRHCVAVSSCTSGLMLVLRAAELSGDVVVPSFTFAATAHAVAWNGLRPAFADIDPGTLTLSAAAARRAVGVRTSAILATHTFGTPCDIEGLSEVAKTNGIRLFFDAAHAFGSLHDGKPIGGFGDAEVFSLSPTKVLVAAEGGIVATNDDVLAERCRIGRDYGNPGDYDCVFVGLNARMSEVHAAIALASLDGLDARIDHRNRLVERYREGLGSLPGIGFPDVMPQDRSTYKDFTILVGAEQFGLRADELGEALAAVGIDTRRYYAPPVDAMKAYRSLVSGNDGLPVTEAAASRVLTLPLWSDMDPAIVDRIVDAVARIRRFVVHEGVGVAGGAGHAV